MAYHSTSNWMGEPTRVYIPPDPDAEYERWRDEREDAMPHHFNKATVQAACWCNACGKETPWRIVDGRRQYCLACQDKKAPAAAKEVQSAQLNLWGKKEGNA